MSKSRQNWEDIVCVPIGWIRQNPNNPRKNKPEINNEPNPEPPESEYSTISVVTGRVKRCMDCVSINKDRICSSYGFERISLTSPQYCPFYVVRGNVDIESIPESEEQSQQPEENGQYVPWDEFDGSDKTEAQPKRYLDAQGRDLFVSAGLGDEYGTFWRSASGGLHRVKSPAMPMVATREEAQRNLDAWAEKKGLKPVEPAGEGEGAA